MKERKARETGRRGGGEFKSILQAETGQRLLEIYWLPKPRVREQVQKRRVVGGGRNLLEVWVKVR